MSSRFLWGGIAVAIGLVVLWMVASMLLAIASTFVHVLLFVASLVIGIFTHPILFIAGVVLVLLIAFLVRRAVTRRAHII